MERKTREKRKRKKKSVSDENAFNFEAITNQKEQNYRLTIITFIPLRIDNVLLQDKSTYVITFTNVNHSLVPLFHS